MKHNFLLFGEASTVHVLVDVSSAFNMLDLIWKRWHVMSLSLWEKSCAMSINFQNLYSSTFSFYCRINNYSWRHVNMFLLIPLLVKCIVWSLKWNLFSSTFYIMDPFCFSVCHKKKLKLCWVLQMSELIFILHYRKLFFIREQFLESYENFQ